MKYLKNPLSTFFLLFITLVHMVCPSHDLLGQSNSLEFFELKKNAEKLYEKAFETNETGDFSIAAIALEKIVSQNPYDGENWIRLGDARFYSKQYSGAIDAYQQAQKIDHGFLENYRYLNFSIAAAYSIMNSTQSSLEWLEKSLVDEKFPFKSQLDQYDFFNDLKENTTFKRLSGEPIIDFSNSTEGWRYDLDYLLSEIKRLNATYSIRPLPKSFISESQQLQNDVADLTDGQIWVRIQHLLAMLGQSHNSVWHFEGSDKFEITQLPLTFYQFSDGLYIINAANDSLIGSRVEQIGKLATSEAIERVSTVVTSETPMKIKWLGPTYLRMPQVLHMLEIIESSKQVPLVLQTRDHERKQITLNPIPIERRKKLFASKLTEKKSPPLYLSDPNNPYWFRRMRDDNIVYFQFNQVVDASDEPISDFASRLQDSLTKHGDPNLIVDLRINNGGNTFRYVDLLRTLIWYDQQLNTQLFVVIGRNTYSAAQNFLVDLERLTDAIFIGERSGGKPNTHGDEARVVLPYSGLTVGLSSAYWQQSHPRDNRRWIAPDIPVELSSKEYFANIDPIIEAIKLITK